MMLDYQSLAVKWVTAVIETFQKGGRLVRAIVLLAFGAILVGVPLIIAGEQYGAKGGVLSGVGAAVAVAGGLMLTGLAAKRLVASEEERSKAVEAVAERAREHPTEPKAAWDLAQIKLEGYLNRNLRQVSSIFWLTLVTMFAGFALIVYGLYRAFQVPESIEPSLVSAAAGTIVEFIGASFLLVYKSTMQQAREYVEVLERINAVGMSVQILDTISNAEPLLKDKSRAEIAKALLTLYRASSGRAPARQTKRAHK